MTQQSENASGQHALVAFDHSLTQLHAQVIEMANLVMYQLDQTLLALDEADRELALQVMVRDGLVNQFELQIDNAVVELLARHAPVATDLRTLISISKIVYELEKIGDEIAAFAKVVSVLFDPATSDPNPHLLEDIVKIANLVKGMLAMLLLAFDRRESSPVYCLLQYDHECELELQEGIRHQLSYVLKNVRFIGRGMDMMQILKMLEHCNEHSRNIAEYIIFMLEGVDVRHRGLSTNAESL